MKKVHIFLILILLVLCTGCSDQKDQATDGKNTSISVSEAITEEGTKSEEESTVSASQQVELAEGRVISIFEMAGKASIERAEKGTIKGFLNMKLQNQDKITVGKKSSLTLRLDEDKFITLDENTSISLEISGDSKNSLTKVYLYSGTVLSNLTAELEDDSSYEISTPKSTMSVRGTVFSVGYFSEEGDKATVPVNVLDGKVLIQVADKDGNPVGEGILTEAGNRTILQETKEKGTVLVEKEAVSLEDLPPVFLKQLKKIEKQQPELFSETIQKELNRILKNEKKKKSKADQDAAVLEEEPVIQMNLPEEEDLLEEVFLPERTEQSLELEEEEPLWEPEVLPVNESFPDENSFPDNALSKAEILKKLIRNRSLLDSNFLDETLGMTLPPSPTPTKRPTPTERPSPTPTKIPSPTPTKTPSLAPSRPPIPSPTPTGGFIWITEPDPTPEPSPTPEPTQSPMPELSPTPEPSIPPDQGIEVQIGGWFYKNLKDALEYANNTEHPTIIYALKPIQVLENMQIQRQETTLNMDWRCLMLHSDLSLCGTLILLDLEQLNFSNGGKLYITKTGRLETRTEKISLDGSPENETVGIVFEKNEIGVRNYVNWNHKTDSAVQISNKPFIIYENASLNISPKLFLSTNLVLKEGASLHNQSEEISGFSAQGGIKITISANASIKGLGKFIVSDSKVVDTSQNEYRAVEEEDYDPEENNILVGTYQFVTENINYPVWIRQQ